MEAISGRKTLQQIAADHGVHPIQVSQWKNQLLEGGLSPAKWWKFPEVSAPAMPGLSCPTAQGFGA